MLRRNLKRKFKKEGSEVYENIVQLKLPAADGKMRMTDVATCEQLSPVESSGTVTLEELKLSFHFALG